MSDIKVGDLVVLSRARPCGCNAALGKVFKVRDIWHGIKNIRCRVCGVPVIGTSFAWVDGEDASCELWT